MFDTYSTAYMLGAYGVMDKTKPFLFDLLFTMQQQFATEEVYFDKVERARRLAPLVVPTVRGRAERSRGYQTTSLIPGYVKPKHVVEPNRTLKRRPGEALLGNLSPEERRDLIILDNMRLEDDQIARREEWMACQLALTGAMTLQSDEFPTRIIDLQRNPAHTVVLTGAARWGQTGVDALGFLRSSAFLVQKNSGFHPGVVIMDPLAANLFIQSPGVLQIMQSFRQTTGNINLGGVVVGGVGTEAKLLGETSEFQFWSYQQYYTDDNGNVQQFLPDNSVIMADPVGVQGTRLYGAIQDVRSLQAIPRFPKNWIEEDPSAEYTMLQSAPLPVFGWPDASFSAKIA